MLAFDSAVNFLLPTLKVTLNCVYNNTNTEFGTIYNKKHRRHFVSCSLRDSLQDK